MILLTILGPAFGLGALHGLEPGHGKALLAFMLVGARATFKQAVILAGALTFAHTIAVLLLGALLFFAAGFATESLFTLDHADFRRGRRGDRRARPIRCGRARGARTRSRARSRSRRTRTIINDHHDGDRSFARDSRIGAAPLSQAPSSPP